MFCTNCGKQIPNDSVFCEFCGTKIDNAKAADEPVKMQPRPEKQANTEPENNKSNSSNFNSPPKAIDVDSEVAVIRENYYSTQANPGIEKTINGVKYYYKDNSITKIVCYGNSDTNYSREYFYKDNKLYFAFIFNGNKENRLYYCDNTLIRYIDENKNTFDYDGTKIDCPFSEFAENESVNLLQQFSR